MTSDLAEPLDILASTLWKGELPAEVAEILEQRGYHPLERIGAGGQAVVYLCDHKSSGMKFAVKIACADTVSYAQELSVLRRVWNPHVINVYESFVENGYSFLVLEYCSGGSLQKLCDKKSTPISTVGRLCWEMLVGLQACHSRQVAHSDLKPSNVLLDPFMEPHLADFGFARSLPDDGRTITGRLGT